MKNFSPKIILIILVMSLLSLGFNIQLTSGQDVDVRSGSFTTDKGTFVEVVASLSHEGGGSNPVLFTNKEYNLNIEIMLGSLGDVEDIHDFELKLEMSTDALLGPGKLIYSSYYFDPETSMSTPNSTKTYQIPIFVSGNFVDTTANLDITLSLKEAVDISVDPTTEYEVGYELTLNANPEEISVDLSGNNTETRSQEPLTDEGTKTRMEVDLMHEGDISGKPSLKSSEFYQVSVNITLLDLGVDAGDIHDLEMEVVMEDSSVTDFIPGNSAVKYFSTYATDVSELSEGESIIFEFILQANTNINDTEVQLKFTIKFREDISGGFDPESTFDMTYEIALNQNLEGFSEDDSPLNPYFGLIFFVAIVPIIRRNRE